MMILRDKHGEIEVPFTQEFQIGKALLRVVCPDSATGMVCCRVAQGTVAVDEGVNVGPLALVNIDPREVAQQVRLYRLGGLQIDAAKETRRGPNHKPAVKRQQQPETGSLF